MTTQAQRHTCGVPSDVFSAAFWVTVASALALVLFASATLVWVLFTVVGAGVSIAWWNRRHSSRFRLLFGFMCSLFAVLFLLFAGRLVLLTVEVPIDSLGQRTVECGSVLRPATKDELKVAGMIQDELTRVCADWRGFRANQATGLLLVGILLGVRAAGHVLPRVNTADHARNEEQ